jgi:hypothetical protein
LVSHGNIRFIRGLRRVFFLGGIKGGSGLLPALSSPVVTTYSGKGQHAKIGYMATAVVLSFCALIAEIFFMVITPSGFI